VQVKGKCGYLRKIEILKIVWEEVSSDLLHLGYYYDLRLTWGKTGSIGHISAAATVAASSFEMKITDSQPPTEAIDIDQWNRLRRSSSRPAVVTENNDRRHGPFFVEPSGASDGNTGPTSTSSVPVNNVPEHRTASRSSEVLKGKVQRLGDFIDTYAVSCILATI
jgi:hypothetical protein